jgi:hypothetical protein
VPNEEIKVVGAGGAPDVTVTGPGERRASSAGQRFVAPLPFVINRDARTHTTYVTVLHPRGGVYRVRANRGSARIVRVLAAHGFTPHIKVRVRGKGRRRTLRWTTNMQPGERVTFVERGKGVDKRIATVRRGHGSLSFTPTPGPGGTRLVVASATENGLAVTLRPGRRAGGQLTVGRFRVAGPRRLARVRKLLAYRNGKRLVVSFTRSPGAKRYAVIVHTTSGLKTEFEVRRTGLSKVLPDPAPSGTVSVLPLGDELVTRNGPVARTKIAPSKPKAKKAKAKRKHRPKKSRHPKHEAHRSAGPS